MKSQYEAKGKEKEKDEKKPTGHEFAKKKEFHWFDPEAMAKEEESSDEDEYQEQADHKFHIPHLPHIPHVQDIPIIRKLSRRARKSL